MFSDAVGNERLLRRCEEEKCKYYVFKISLIAFYKMLAYIQDLRVGVGMVSL